MKIYGCEVLDNAIRGYLEKQREEIQDQLDREFLSTEIFYFKSGYLNQYQTFQNFKSHLLKKFEEYVERRKWYVLLPIRQAFFGYDRSQPNELVKLSSKAKSDQFSLEKYKQVKAILEAITEITNPKKLLRTLDSLIKNENLWERSNTLATHINRICRIFKYELKFEELENQYQQRFSEQFREVESKLESKIDDKIKARCDSCNYSEFFNMVDQLQAKNDELRVFESQSAPLETYEDCYNAAVYDIQLENDNPWAPSYHSKSEYEARALTLFKNVSHGAKDSYDRELNDLKIQVETIVTLLGRYIVNHQLGDHFISWLAKRDFSQQSRFNLLQDKQSYLTQIATELFQENNHPEMNLSN